MIILPTKFLPAERSLVFIGGEIIALLASGPRSPEDISIHINDGRKIPESFDMIALALSFLYVIGAIDEGDGMIHLVNQSMKDPVDEP